MLLEMIHFWEIYLLLFVLYIDCSTTTPSNGRFIAGRQEVARCILKQYHFKVVSASLVHDYEEFHLFSLIHQCANLTEPTT